MKNEHLWQSCIGILKRTEHDSNRSNWFLEVSTVLYTFITTNWHFNLMCILCRTSCFCIFTYTTKVKSVLSIGCVLTGNTGVEAEIIFALLAPSLVRTPNAYSDRYSREIINIGVIWNTLRSFLYICLIGMYICTYLVMVRAVTKLKYNHLFCNRITWILCEVNFFWEDDFSLS